VIPGVSVGLLREYCKQARDTARIEELLIEGRSQLARIRREAPAPNELSVDVVQAMIHEYRRGASIYQLAAWHRIRRTTVRDALRRNGVTIRDGNRALLTAEHKSEIRSRHSGGESAQTLAEAFKVSHSTIRRALSANEAGRE